MEKLARIFYILSEYIILLMVTLGYWVEMAEEMEPDNIPEKLGKGLMVLIKVLVFPK